LWIGAHLRLGVQNFANAHVTATSYLTLDVGLRKNGKSKNGMLDYGVWKFIYRVNMSAS
jgi:hypothetical protein